MSQFKIVKKRGRHVKKPIRRAVTWRQEMLSCMQGVTRHSLTDTAPINTDNLSDADFVFWLLFNMCQYRWFSGYIYTKVTSAFEGRGVVFHIFGDTRATRDAYKSINTLFSHAWEKWCDWNYRIEALSEPATRIYRHTPDERMRKGGLSIELRIYPPLDTVAYTTCKELYAKGKKEGQYTAATVCNILCRVLEQDLAKKSREMQGNVTPPIHMSTHCK